MKQFQFALWQFGFRPFFLGASIFAVMYMLLWIAVYQYQFPLQLTGMSMFQWHAHEMVYGYSMAVIAGFLLTAVSNWTGLQTIQNTPLMLLFAMWGLARITFNLDLLYVAAGFDLIFQSFLIFAIAKPVFQVKQWKQMGILSKLVLLLVSQMIFYLGIFGYWSQGVHVGLYAGFLLVIALILTMGRRLLPFFIEMGVGYKVKLYNAKWLDNTNLLLFLAFFIAYLLAWTTFSTWMALALFVITTMRLVGWYTQGIWRKPLLWSLFIALVLIDLGFLLLALNLFSSIPPFQAFHALGIGGIGLISISVMSRVSLAHTGRNIHKLPVVMSVAFILIIASSLLRSVFPLFAPQYYLPGVFAAQILWVIAFLMFLLVFTPMLLRARIDGKPG